MRFGTLLDESIYLCSIRTMHRILAQNGELKERRNQLRHPQYTKPELLATGPIKSGAGISRSCWVRPNGPISTSTSSWTSSAATWWAGIFDAQRIGDDVSGKVWERTRRMGVNTLAFRLAQHRAFFAADADCVPFTSRIPWERTRQWLDVVAKSGTVLLISPEPGAVGPEMRAAIQSAFAIAAKGGQSLAPIDWLETHTPYRWQADASSHHLDERYDWLQPEGALPFEV